MAIALTNTVERAGAEVVALPGVDLHLTAEQALRAAIDTGIFSALRELEPLDGGRAVQSVYIALIRRLPNVIPSRERIAVDCGYSESSVKRAIKLLESAKLMTVERAKGRSSAYHLADIRSPEVSSRCHSAIRSLIRGKARKESIESRVTSGPPRSSSRVTSEPRSRVTSEPGVGSPVAHKGSIKFQGKQQVAAAVETNSEEGRELTSVLQRWGLQSAGYLAAPGHHQAIQALTENPSMAATLIDRTMRAAEWSCGAGVGAKVAYLRDRIPATLKAIADEKRARVERESRAKQRARQLAERLVGDAGQEANELRNERGFMLRDFARLGESKEVITHLVRDDSVRDRLYEEELLRDEIKAEVESLSDEAYRATCEELFNSNPGIRLLYSQANRESTGLRLKLVEHLMATRLGRRSRGGEKGGGGGLEPAA